MMKFSSGFLPSYQELSNLSVREMCRLSPADLGYVLAALQTLQNHLFWVGSELSLVSGTGAGKDQEYFIKIYFIGFLFAWCVLVLPPCPYNPNCANSVAEQAWYMQVPVLGGTSGPLDNAESTPDICVPCAVWGRWWLLCLYLQFRNNWGMLWEAAWCTQGSDGSSVSDTEIHFLISLTVISVNTWVDKRRNQ